MGQAGGPWHLTADQERAARDHFGGGRAAPSRSDRRAVTAPAKAREPDAGSTPPGWTRPELERFGLHGWHPLSELRSHLGSIERTAGGVYVVYRTSDEEPLFLGCNPGGTWRGDPTVERAALIANWAKGANVVYIGKADHGQLRNRLRAYRSFGEGGKGRHWGGRLIWQLADAEDLLVAWMVLDRSSDPLLFERHLLAAFRATNGHAPFANDPDRLGR